MSANAPTTEDLSLLDVEPFTMDEIGELAAGLLLKMNKQGVSRLTSDEQVQISLIRTCFEV